MAGKRRSKPEAAPPAPEESATPGAAGATPSQFSSFANDPELMADFLVESREHLANVEARMLVLERKPRDSEAIHDVFRAFHTIKGLAGFLELPGIQEMTHQMETLLDEVRNFRLEIGTEVADIVLQCVDRLNRALRALDSGVHDRTAPELAADAALLQRIRALLELQAQSAVEPAPEPAAAAAPSQDAGSDAVPQLAAEARTVKVDIGKLDDLVEMVGETVVAASMVRYDPEMQAHSSPGLERNLARLSRLIIDIQQTAMTMRMVPIGTLFHKIARVARDLSRKSGKPLELRVEGEDTELDRHIVEGLADPLLHMVRNSIDHGLEDAATRAAAGKPASGTLDLRAAHRAGHILVEIADDGRGLDTEKIRRRAIERGLIEPNTPLSEDETCNLIFLPGFSTAEQVTDISGRGVGMDVVRRHIQKLRGRIEIRSEPGKGTLFTLKLPLTLAIIEGLVVRVANERYIVPMTSVREVLQGRQTPVVTVQGRGEVARIRESVLPLVRINRRFGVEGAHEDFRDGLLIVAENESGTFCLLVDELVGRQEVVIKSLGESLKNTPGITGGAILGDGRIGLILDIEDLYESRTVRVA